MITGSEKTYKSYFYILGFVLNASLGAFFVGYKLGELNLLLVDLKHIYLWSSSQISMFTGLLNTMVPIGAIFGGFLSGNFFSKIGRRWGLILADIMGIIGCFICIFVGTHAFPQIIGRFLTGISAGINCQLVPMYVNELTPIEISGIMGSFFQSFLSIGILIAYGMGLNIPADGDNYDITDNWWKYVFAFPIITCSFRTLLLLIYYNFDTPFSLLKRRKGEEVSKVLEKIYNDKFIVEQVHNLDEKINSSSDISYKQLFTFYRTRLILGIILMVAQQFSGVNAVVTESSTLESSLGTVQEVQILTIMNSIVLFISAVLAGVITDKLGRRTILLYGNMACFICLIFMGILMEFNSKTMSSIAVFMTYLFLFCCGISLGPIIWIYQPEILPDKGMSLTVMTNWCCCGLVVFLTPISIDSFGVSVCYYFFALILVICQFYFYFAIKETKGKTAMEIDELFGNVAESHAINDEGSDEGFNPEIDKKFD